MAEALVTLDGVAKDFDKDAGTERVLDGIDAEVRDGEVVTVLGKSGCGKSTLLNIVGGFEHPTHGQARFAGKPISGPSRDVIMLFQDYALLPWRSALKNIDIALEPEGLSKAEREDRAKRYLQLVGLEREMHQFPSQLSGGMKQRVAIARALAVQPKLILMDEPFAALDTFTRYYLQDELLRIREQEATNMILVTHDIDEAVYLSDRILMMDSHPGKVRKSIPIELSHPRDRSSTEFHAYRKKILDEFQFSLEKPGPEYYI